MSYILDVLDLEPKEEVTFSKVFTSSLTFNQNNHKQESVFQKFNKKTSSLQVKSFTNIANEYKQSVEHDVETQGHKSNKGVDYMI